MQIGGLQELTLSDFPGRVAAILFTQGCNFRCPFCHNGGLIPATAPPGRLTPEVAVWELLETRRGKLDGLVVSGGEPTLQPDLAEFLARARTLGYATQLDTNGSRPEVVRALLAAKLLDRIAMDLKAPWEIYPRLAGVNVAVEKVQESLRLIVESGIAHEFRTTRVESLLNPEACAAIEALVPSGSPHRWHTFQPEHALDASLRPAAGAEAKAGGEKNLPEV